MEQPDIVVIVGDDFGRELFSFYNRQRPGMDRYGNAYTAPFPYPQFKHIEALARNGVTHTGCVSTPICSATRASALTGMYGFESGLGSLIRGAAAANPTTSSTFTDLGQHTGPTIRSIAHHAKANGYHCIATGKWHLFLNEGDPDFGSGPCHPIRDMGFDRWDGTPRNPQPNFDNYAWYEWNAQQCKPVLTQETNTHLTQKTSEVASAAWLEIKNRSDKPIFHWIAFNCAHAAEGKFDFPPDKDLGQGKQHFFGSMAPPEKWSNTRIRAGLEHLDYWIGQFFEAIGYDPDNPSEEDPVVLFWGDNGTDTNGISDVPGKSGTAPWPNTESNYPPGHPGWSGVGGAWQGDHADTLDVSPYESMHFKGFPYVDGTYVPLVVAGNPHHVQRVGEVDDSLIDVVDFLPTLAELMGSAEAKAAIGNIAIDGTPNAGDKIEINDGWGNSVVFEWTQGGQVSAGSRPVPINADRIQDAAALAAEIEAVASEGSLHMEVLHADARVVLTNALRGYEGNQGIRVVGVNVRASGMFQGATAPSTLSGFSFAPRLKSTSSAPRKFSANGSQFAPNGLLQDRSFIARSYVREDASNRWALINIERAGELVVELYDIGQPVAASATGSIALNANLQDGDSITLADDVRATASKKFGSRIIFTARMTVAGRSEFLIGTSSTETLRSLVEAIEASALELKIDELSNTLSLENASAGYCGNVPITHDSGGRFLVTGMSGGAASDQRQVCDLNSKEYVAANGVHPELQATIAAEQLFHGLRSTVQTERSAQLLSAGESTHVSGGQSLEIEGSFAHGSTFRVFDILVGAKSQILPQDLITSWDLKVLDESAPDPSIPIYSLLGMDPAGVNADGVPYVGPKRSSEGGWDVSQSRSGYLFRLDVDTRYFPHAIGTTYLFELSYATPYDGKTTLTLKLNCVASPATQAKSVLIPAKPRARDDSGSRSRQRTDPEKPPQER